MVAKWTGSEPEVDWKWPEVDWKWARSGLDVSICLSVPLYLLDEPYAKCRALAPCDFLFFFFGFDKTVSKDPQKFAFPSCDFLANWSALLSWTLGFCAMLLGHVFFYTKKNSIIPDVSKKLDPPRISSIHTWAGVYQTIPWPLCPNVPLLSKRNSNVRNARKKSAKLL